MFKRWPSRPAFIAFCLIVGNASLWADDYSTLLQSAAAATRAGNYNDAISQYQAALKLRPNAPEALNNLAVVYYQVHRYAEAYAAVRDIWQKHSELKSAALIAGLSAVQCNRPRDAIAPLEHLLAIEPSNRDALLALASAHYALHELSPAVQVYRRETANSPQDSLAWYGLAICLEGLAEDSSRTLSKMDGGAAYSKRLLAEYLQSTGDQKLAAEAFGQSSLATQDAPSPVVASQYQLARTLADQSRDAFEHFVALAPDSWQTAVFFGDVARQHGDLLTALAQYQKAAAAHPESPAPDLGLGTVYWEMGDFDHAADYLHRTLKRNPGAMQAVFELANIAVRHHDEATAIPLLKQYLSDQPDALAAHADLGRAYFHLAQYDAAAVELKKAAPADDQGDIHYQLSLTLRKLGRPQEADAALAESVAIRRERSARDQRLHQAN